MRRWMMSAIVAVLAIGTIAVGADASSRGSSDRPILKFQTMAPVAGPFVGSANPIRGLNGGGLPWQIERANGVLKTTGRLDVRVKGLVLLAADPVPLMLQGTNPVPNFVAVVSCTTVVNGAVATANVATAPFPATTRGNSHIDAIVSLPSPCIAPVVFVGPSATVWFSATGV
jgi:hypothetical protein